MREIPWTGDAGFDNEVRELAEMCALDDDHPDAESWERDWEEHRPAGLSKDREGFCYALVNESMPGIVKIGMTKKRPEIRAKQLSQQTAAPTPFVLVYFQRYFDMRDAERFLHERLDSRRVSNKEFFRVGISELPKLFHCVNCRENN